MDESQSPLPDARQTAAPGEGAPPGGAPGRGDRVEPSTAAVPVEVAVKRSGGFAGLTRQWVADPPAAEAPLWIELIAKCPWDAAPPVPGDGDVPDDDARAPRGADRFTWWIRARCGDADQRETELPDDEIVGAWRELVDAVRAWSRPGD